jgi:hypothetical protein
MKTLTVAALSVVFLGALASPSRADDSNTVRWKTIIGIEQAGNTVGGVTGAGQPWSALSGEVFVNLADGTVEFEVRGLVLAGGNSIGTPDGVANVTGTLVCGLMPGETPTVISTSPIALSPQGNAEFYGSFNSSTAGCSATDVAFLVVNAATGAWIGNGAVRSP